MAFGFKFYESSNYFQTTITGLHISQTSKTFGKFFRSYSDLLSKLGEISIQEYVSEEISQPVFYGNLVYKLRRVKCEANFVSGSKIVKRFRRRKYDPVIIERTICLLPGPSTALYLSFLKHCTLTNKAVGTIWRDLSKPPQRRQGLDPRPLWLLVGTPLVLGTELASRRAEHSLLTRMSLYIFDITRQLPVQARVTATEFKEFSQYEHLIQTIVKIMHKRTRFKSLCLNRC